MKSDELSRLQLLEVLVDKSDFELINYLKTKNNVSEDELRALGTILIQGLRRYCL